MGGLREGPPDRGRDPRDRHDGRVFRGARGGRRSDMRLKHDIVLLGRIDDGLGFYRFTYNGGHTAYVGVMAQEVQNIVPRAVSRDRDGFLLVDYDRLGVRFMTWDEWRSRPGATTPTVN